MKSLGIHWPDLDEDITYFTAYYNADRPDIGSTTRAGS